jgi:DNA-binding transcriptional LysR family regulator
VPFDDRARRRFKLRDLDVLMAVIDAGSMGKAAARLGMAQPAVSKAVADLEHMLGARLLDRSRQGVEPCNANPNLARSLHEATAID